MSKIIFGQVRSGNEHVRQTLRGSMNRSVGRVALPKRFRVVPMTLRRTLLAIPLGEGSNRLLGLCRH